ncbi:probable 5` Pro-FAR isomerase [Serendipita indica DSM 11827]|uniref:Probable 5` Pro-FAR isomerase n=1 Tax=Serendipita indica (strain DSM 11827) TaxID=1109443 RepID=G4T9Z3_SERID|nr:probable 5` Pro-FAR isomerase [Serendipita indica DSM 11827]
MSSTRRHSVFRPCIDLHNGLVKQIVGGTLSDVTPSELKTNFVSSKTAGEFARLYKEHNLRGGHVIKLGPGNDAAAEEALTEWNNGLHIGGGITQDNCQQWIDAGAEKVIVTSYLFPSGQFSLERLQGISAAVGKERLVVDVSCRRRNDKWIIAMNKWQDMTDMENLLTYSPNTAELAEWVTIPTTYAGGAKDISDLDLVDRLSQGRVDLTFGSALDIFGGSLVRFDDLVEYNRKYQSL